MNISTLNFKNKYSFGVEIEFDKVNLSTLFEHLKSSGIPVSFHLNHKISQNIDFHNNWILDKELEITKCYDSGKEFQYVGGELSSKILYDDYDSWRELSLVCSCLKDCGAVASSNCGLHITIDVSKFLGDRYFFEVFSKIIAIYESDIDMFYMGEKYFVRDNKEQIASSISFPLKRHIDKVNFEEDNFLELLIHKTGCFCLHDGVSFFKIKNGLIEIRYPNATFHEKIIQNDICFTLSLFQAIQDRKISLDVLNSQISKDYLYKKNVGNSEMFLSFIDLIVDYPYQEDLKRQYQKVLSSKRYL